MNTDSRIGPHSVRLAALAVAALLAAAPAPAAAMQILPATDHGELSAEVSGRAVSRIALADDRIARVIRAPDGFAVEHDPARGDLYLRPAVPAAAGAAGAAPGAAEGRLSGPGRTVTLFLGTEKGFTYRLTLAVRDRASAQILIRDPAAAASAETGETAVSGARIGALAALVRAVARREPPPGHVIETGDGERDGNPAAMTIVETWRGPRFTARVIEVGADAFADAAGLAAAAGPGVAAAWLAAPGTGPSGGRIAVVVHAGEARSGAVGRSAAHGTAGARP